MDADAAGDDAAPVAPLRSPSPASVRTPLGLTQRWRRAWSSGRWFALSALVGVVAGLGAIVFQFLSDFLARTLLGRLAGYHPVEPRGESGDLFTVFSYSAATISPFWCIVLPTVGGVAAGWLMHRFAPEARGHGTDAAIEAYHRRNGVVAASVIWVKTLASAITLGTGGSGGREGPIAQIGAGFGSLLATRLGLGHRERRMLLAVGMGAGVAALFRAPLAGALFAAEILYRDADFESEVIMPSLIGCITSYSVYSRYAGDGTLFAADRIANARFFTFGSPLELLPYAAVAVLLVAFGFLWVKTFYGVENVFHRLKVHYLLKPALGGLLTGALALTLSRVNGDGRYLSLLSFGYAPLQEALDLVPHEYAGPAAWSLALTFGALAVGKILSTSLTIGSGGSAGVFGPSMIIGGCLGAGMGIALHQLWPTICPHPGAFAIVGMAAFFTGVARVPISTLLMVSEMTGNYELLVPAMAAGVITFTLGRGAWLYRSQVPRRQDSPAHRGDFIVDVLEGMRVADLTSRFRPAETVTAQTTLRTVMSRLVAGKSHYFPVIGEDGRLAGIFSINDIRRHLHDEPAWDVVVAADVMVTPVLAVTPEDDLNAVLRRCTEKNIDEVPVIDSAESQRLIGMLGRRDVIAAYHAQLSAWRTGGEGD